MIKSDRIDLIDWRSRMTNRRKKRRKESYLWTAVMVICAIGTLVVAVLVITTVFSMIKKDSIEREEQIEETTIPQIVIETEAIYGWVETEQGTKFRENDGSFAKDTWKFWENGLYYLNENEIMEAGKSVAMDGWIYEFLDNGILKDIRLDSAYQGRTPGEEETGKKSLVRSNEFYCYLDTSEDYQGNFSPILYKKSASEKEEYLGGQSVPETTSPNSMAILDGWIYYLPQAREGVVLNTEEQGRNKKLFRMRPGDRTKELIATDVSGILIVEEQLFYASNGSIFKMGSGTSYPVGESWYQVKIEENVAYLVDSLGSLAAGDFSGMKIIGDRQYKLDEGKISYVRPASQIVSGVTYELKEDGGKDSIYWKDNSGQSGILARSEFGINSFCIAEDWIYYSACISESDSEERYSQIYRISMDGTDKRAVSEVFQGNILNLYYYKDQRAIYGEYYPVSWKSGYGQIVAIELNGAVNRIQDLGVRQGNINENKALELLSVSGDTITCYEHDSRWDAFNGNWDVLETKAIQFSAASKELIAGSILVSGESGNSREDAAGEQETESDLQETLEENVNQVITPERPSETIPPAMPPETIPMPGETIGNQAPGTDIYNRPSETIGEQQGTNSIIIPAL